MAFTPRFKAPSQSDLHWIKTTHGGYNKCIVINSTTGSVLPNCTGYAWGRFLEINELTDCDLSRGDAGNWYGHSDPYDRGFLPRLGAIICWSKIGGAGHVAVVEEIKANGDLRTSNSAYNGRRFFLEDVKKSKNYNRGTLYRFQGFIYSPNIYPPVTKNITHKFKWVLFTKKFRRERNPSN